MKISFSSSTLRESVESAQKAQKAYKACARRVRQRCGELKACPDLKTFKALPAINRMGLPSGEEFMILTATEKTSFRIRAVASEDCNTEDLADKYDSAKEIYIEAIGNL